MVTRTRRRRAASHDGVAFLSEARDVAAVISPMRRRILERLRRAPDSSTGVARDVGLPRQVVNYHVRELERAGFLELTEERPRRGTVERIMRPTARAFIVDPELFGAQAADPAAATDRFSSRYLVATAARMVRDVATLAHGAAAAKQRLPTLTLEFEVRFATPAARAAFAEELADAVARLVAKHHDDAPGGRTYRFVVGGHALVRPPARSPK